MAEPSTVSLSPEFRPFAEALLTLTLSHRDWSLGRTGEAIGHALRASQAFEQIKFGAYAARARSLVGLLNGWQRLEVGATMDQAIAFTPDHAAVLRGMLGHPSARGTLFAEIPKTRPSQLLGMLQFASAYNQDSHLPMPAAYGSMAFRGRPLFVGCRWDYPEKPILGGNMIKLTALYGHPADPAAFEAYYAATHMPLVMKMSGFTRLEKAKVVATPSGDKPAYHRMFEFWFETEAAMGAAMGSPEGQAVVADLQNFATGGVTILISAVE